MSSQMKVNLRACEEGCVGVVPTLATRLHFHTAHVEIKSSPILCSVKLCMCASALNQVHKWYYDSGIDCLRYIVKHIYLCTHH